MTKQRLRFVWGWIYISLSLLGGSLLLLMTLWNLSVRKMPFSAELGTNLAFAIVALVCGWGLIKRKRIGLILAYAREGVAIAIACIASFGLVRAWTGGSVSLISVIAIPVQIALSVLWICYFYRRRTWFGKQEKESV